MKEANSQRRAATGRSCLACRRRKIRCDRRRPCNYCAKFGLSCTYPELVSDGKSNHTDERLSSRLERIERSLQRLEVERLDHANGQTPEGSSAGAPEMPTHLKNEGGRLVVDENEDEDGAQYVTGGFWADLRCDGHELPQTDYHSSNLQPTTPDSGSGMLESRDQQGAILGLHQQLIDAPSQHPSERHMFALWQVFLDNVDPVVKMIHVPTVQRQFLWASRNVQKVPPPFEAMMFAIYLSALTSIQEGQACKELFDEDRSVLLARYRLGVERALAKARFMSAPNLTSLQALTLYLICVRQVADKTYVWSMAGLAIRLATRLGLHRDPSLLGSSPFVCEMRRRLWWHIVILDVRVAEDNDMDPAIQEHDFNTDFPANVHDSDLHASMEQPPVEPEQRTDMLFTLCRFEVSYLARRLVFSRAFEAKNGYPNLTLQGKCDLIDELLRKLEARYLKHCDTSVPLCYLTLSSVKMVLAKIRLTVHHPDRNSLDEMARDQLPQLLDSSMEILEYAQSLRCQKDYRQWMWLFQSYIEWDAVAFMLHTLGCVSMPAYEDRAWKAIEIFFDHWKDRVVDGDRRWRRLLLLRQKASASISPGRPEENHRDQWVLSDEAPHSAQTRDSSCPGSRHLALEEPLESLMNPTSDASRLQADGVSDINWEFGGLYHVDAPNWQMDVDMSAFTSWQ